MYENGYGNVSTMPCGHHRVRQIHHSNDSNIQAGAAGMNYVCYMHSVTQLYTLLVMITDPQTHTHVWTVSSDNNICSISIQRCAGVMSYRNKITQPKFLLTAKKMITLSLFVFSVIRASVTDFHNRHLICVSLHNIFYLSLYIQAVSQSVLVLQF